MLTVCVLFVSDWKYSEPPSTTSSRRKERSPCRWIPSRNTWPHTSSPMTTSWPPLTGCKTRTKWCCRIKYCFWCRGLCCYCYFVNTVKWFSVITKGSMVIIPWLDKRGFMWTLERTEHYYLQLVLVLSLWSVATLAAACIKLKWMFYLNGSDLLVALIHFVTFLSSDSWNTEAYVNVCNTA